MKKRNTIFALLAFVVIFSLIAASSISAAFWGQQNSQNPDFKVKPLEKGKGLSNSPNFVDGEILVKYKNDNKPFRVVKVPKGQVIAQAKAYQSRKDVEYAEPNYIAYADFVPNDPYYSPYQWNFDNNDPNYLDSQGIGMEEAWDKADGSGVVVAVIDTGLYLGGQDTPQVCSEIAGRDFVNGDNDSNDDNGHGTHVAGTIAQSTNNEFGVAGIAHAACILPLKALGSDGTGTYADIIGAIKYAVDNGADIINMSLGSNSDSKAMSDAINYASLTTFIVAAAGNENTSDPHYPSAYESVISVSATGYDKGLARYSNYGPTIDIAAPGGDMFEYTYNPAGRIKRIDEKDLNGDGYPDGILQETIGSKGLSYYFYEGTSMAAPHVSGVAALVMSMGVDDPLKVRQILKLSAEDLGTEGWDPYYGNGFLDAYAAVSSVVDDDNLPPVADAGGPYTGTEDVVITFDGTASADEDGSIVSYKWDFGDNSPTATGATTSHLYLAGGTYTVSLTVVDNQGASNSATTTATVVEVNDEPVADAGGPYEGIVDVAIDFDGSATSDFDDDELLYIWSFGDRSSASGTNLFNPSHIYTAAGSYIVKLSVSDGNGGSDLATTTVVISELKITQIFIEFFDIDWSPKGVFYTAVVNMRIADEYGAGVADAVVIGDWSGDVANISNSGVTDADGYVIFKSSSLKKPSSGTTAKFSVTGVVKEPFEWDGLGGEGEIEI
ncbi:MAG: S8 family serine peptidase [Patescibacteria group bacterium]|nr:S8 family serine peptidase [Patescibacteria group bacterium]